MYKFENACVLKYIRQESGIIYVGKCLIWSTHLNDIYLDSRHWIRPWCEETENLLTSTIRNLSFIKRPATSLSIETVVWRLDLARLAILLVMVGSWSVSSVEDLCYLTLGNVGSIKTEEAVSCPPSSSANPCPRVALDIADNPTQIIFTDENQPL